MKSDPIDVIIIDIMNTTNWLNKRKNLIILAVIGFAFLLIYSWLFINIEPKFTSPDETANYYFIKLFAEKNQLRFYEPLNEIADGIVKPRSMGYVNGYTIPGSFLGIILIYGLVAKIFGSWIILYLTPLFSVIGVLFFYLFIKEIFSEKIAFISSLLLFVLPPYWYYSSRGMFHNILFIDLLIIGLYFLIKALNLEVNIKSKWLFFCLAGFFIGLSLITRTSEITWVGLVTIILFIIYHKKVRWYYILIFISMLIVLFSIIFYLNNKLYSSPFSFAYSKESIDITSLETISQTIFYKFKKLLLPFGINLNITGTSTLRYLILIFPWFSILFICGFFWLWKSILLEKLNKIFPKIKKRLQLNKQQKIYILIFSIITIWLIIYYASGEFYGLSGDLISGENESIIGSSYLRYWLPIYVFGLPFCVFVIINLKIFFQAKIIKYSILPIIILLFIFFSINSVLLDPTQGIIKLKIYNKDNIKKENEIISFIDNNGVIISNRSDKIFFPKRKVIINPPAKKNKSNKIMTKLINNVPVYYFYNPFDENSQNTLEMFNELGLDLYQIYIFKNQEILYRLI